MKRSLMLALVATIFVGTDLPAQDDKAAELRFAIRLTETKLVDGVESGSPEVISAPTLITLENQTCSISMGNEITLPDDTKEGKTIPSVEIACKTGKVTDGVVPLDITISRSRAITTAETKQIQTESARTLSRVKLGETMKLPLLSRDPAKRSQMELTITQCK